MPTLLIVDDSPSIRQMLRMTFAAANYTVIEAADGMEALEKATSEQVDAIITDLNMPRMNGLALVRHLRATPSLLGIPIVVLTTESDETARKEASSAGATAWTTKPFDANDLLKLVSGLVR